MTGRDLTIVGELLGKAPVGFMTGVGEDRTGHAQLVSSVEVNAPCHTKGKPAASIQVRTILPPTASPADP